MTRAQPRVLILKQVSVFILADSRPDDDDINYQYTAIPAVPNVGLSELLLAMSPSSCFNLPAGLSRHQVYVGKRLSIFSVVVRAQSFPYREVSYC